MSTLDGVTVEDRFHFDLTGFLILRGVLSQEECQGYLKVLQDLEAQEYEDGFPCSNPEPPPKPSGARPSS